MENDDDCKISQVVVGRDLPRGDRALLFRVVVAFSGRDLRVDAARRHRSLHIIENSHVDFFSLDVLFQLFEFASSQTQWDEE